MYIDGTYDTVVATILKMKKTPKPQNKSNTKNEYEHKHNTTQQEYKFWQGPDLH